MRVVVYGSRPDGHARVVIETLLADRTDMEVVGLVDDFPENAGRSIGSATVIGSGSDLARLLGEGVEGVLLGFGAARGRRERVQAVERAGLDLPNVIHRLANVSASAKLESGVQALPFANVGPGARVGRGVLLNTGALIEHDVTIGECTVIGPGAVLAGRATLGPGVEIGARAVVLPDVEIDAGAVVGAGSVVTSAVARGQTVAGVPARPLALTGRDG